MAGVDELFSGEPAPAPKDRLPVVTRWLVAAAILDLIGPCTFLSVPGAAATLWAWYLADEEVARAEDAGETPERVRKAKNLRGVAFALLFLCAVLLFAQVAVFGALMYGGVELPGAAPAPP